MRGGTARPQDRRVVVDASGQGTRAGLRAAWDYRVVAGFLIWRDIRVRYKQSLVGVAWAVFQPVGLALVFALFLGRFAKVPSGEHPYWLLALSGLTIFNYFAQSVSAASNALIDNPNLVSKVYLPRLLLPAAGAGSYLLDAVVASVVLVIAALLHGSAAWTAPLAILLPLLAWVAAMSIGLWLSAVNVRFRDVKVLTPFMLQVWLFATPVAYPVDLVPERFRMVYAINPMVGIVEVERWIVLGDGSTMLLLPGIATCAVLLIFGSRYFVRSANWFADVI